MYGQGFLIFVLLLDHVGWRYRWYSYASQECFLSDRTRLRLVGFISIFRTEITKLIVELNENKEAKQSFFRKAEMPEEDQSHGGPWWNVFGYRRDFNSWKAFITSVTHQFFCGSVEGTFGVLRYFRKILSENLLDAITPSRLNTFEKLFKSISSC